MGLSNIICIKKCSNCGKDIEVRHKKRLNNKNIFCSRKCEGEYRKKNNPNYIPCEICGTLTYKKPSSGYTHTFCSISCHAEYKKKNFVGENNHQFGLKGELNSSFKSNEKITNYGYRKIRCLEHPFKDCDDFVFEHRLIAEKYLLTDENSIEIDGKKYLKKEYVVHHIDENKLNNSVENLLVILLSEHTKLHHPKTKIKKPNKKKELLGKNVKCKHCGKEFYTSNKNRICCSVECSNKLNNRGTSIIKCDNCGNEFKIKNSRMNKSNKLFCCKNCYSEYKKKVG